MRVLIAIFIACFLISFSAACDVEEVAAVNADFDVGIEKLTDGTINFADYFASTSGTNEAPMAMTNVRGSPTYMVSENENDFRMDDVRAAEMAEMDTANDVRGDPEGRVGISNANDEAGRSDSDFTITPRRTDVVKNPNLDDYRYYNFG